MNSLCHIKPRISLSNYSKNDFEIKWGFLLLIKNIEFCFVCLFFEK